MKPRAIDVIIPPLAPPASALPTAPQMSAITSRTMSAGSVSVMLGILLN